MTEENQPQRMLSQLGFEPIAGADVPISGLSVDSRLVKPGHLFAALPGFTVHGGKFIQYALRMGAAAVLTDQEGADLAGSELAAAGIVPQVVKDPRLVLSRAAALWFGAQPETVVAITGTNGKTSVATFVRQIWEELGLSAVNFGTTGVEGAVAAPLGHTTPEPITLHNLLKDLAEQGVTHAAMEASSHGLAQKRLDGVKLTAAGFTNFSQDHLDFHDNFEAYFAAKMELFQRVLPIDGTAVVDLDDEMSKQVLGVALKRGQKTITVGKADAADLKILGQRFDATGQDLRFSYNGQVQMTRLELIGGFQASNVLLSAGLAIACGAKPADVFEALPKLTTVRGRMELAARRTNGASVFVDYAHTPDALETALKAMRPHVMGRLIVVFGAGGDRDKSKRPLMGKAAAGFADVAIVTDDNPRSEIPAAIRAEILPACPEATEIGDRAQAILAGVDTLGPGDTLLIAGKGHETGQIVGDDILEFNDVEQASVAVAALDGLGL